MTTVQHEIVVIGGGAAGLMAAGTAAARGHRVTILEKMDRLGIKLRISGKGRCNITNDTTVPGLEKAIPDNAKFLRTAFYAFGPKETMAFFEEHGVSVKTERGGRVFPVSDNADDVVNALVDYCRALDVRMLTGVDVKRILVENGAVQKVQTEDGRTFPANAVILAAGGASYPGTGSTGDGYKLARELGHTIMPPRPSLVPVVTEEAWAAELQGLSLRNVTLTAFSPDGKKLYSELGEMLFTHYGVTGPLVLTASRHIGDIRNCRLEIDLKPGLTDEMLDERVLRDFAGRPNKQYANALDDLLPQSLIPVIVRLSNIPPLTPVHQITREQRHTLVTLLKHLTLTVKQLRPITEAIITRGGVSVKEIDPRTMASKLVTGLLFAGEIIDVDAYTGGFNLQIAWSTGRLAGISA